LSQLKIFYRRDEQPKSTTNKDLMAALKASLEEK